MKKHLITHYIGFVCHIEGQEFTCQLKDKLSNGTEMLYTFEIDEMLTQSQKNMLEIGVFVSWEIFFEEEKARSAFNFIEMKPINTNPDKYSDAMREFDALFDTFDK